MNHMDETAMNSEPKPQQNKLQKGRSIRTVGFGIVIVILVIAVAVFLLPPQNKTSGGLTTVATQASQLSGGGPGNYYLSQSEMNALFGSGWNYTARFDNLGVNTTVGWDVYLSSSGVYHVAENVYRENSVNAAVQLYRQYNQGIKSSFNANWVTSQINGMNYTYGYIKGAPYLDIIGIKNTTVVYLAVGISNSQSQNVTKYAGTIANDIP